MLRSVQVTDPAALSQNKHIGIVGTAEEPSDVNILLAVEFALAPRLYLETFPTGRGGERFCKTTVCGEGAVEWILALTTFRVLVEDLPCVWPTSVVRNEVCNGYQSY